MKAVTCTNGKLEVVDQPTPTPAKGQLLLDVIRCGICGSDLHARNHCDEVTEVMAAPSTPSSSNASACPASSRASSRARRCSPASS